MIALNLGSDININFDFSITSLSSKIEVQEWTSPVKI